MLSQSRAESHPGVSTGHRPADCAGGRVCTLERPRAWLRRRGGVRGGQTLLGVSPLLRPLTRGPQAPGSDAASGGAPLQKRGRPRDGLADCSAPPSTCSRPPSSLREQVLRGGLIPAPARSSAQLPALCGPGKTLTLAVPTD